MKMFEFHFNLHAFYFDLMDFVLLLFQHTEDQPEFPIITRKYFVQFMFLKEWTSEHDLLGIEPIEDLADDMEQLDGQSHADVLAEQGSQMRNASRQSGSIKNQELGKLEKPRKTNSATKKERTGKKLYFSCIF